MRKITGWLAAFGLAAALASGTAVQVYAAPAETEETAAVSAEETADSAETAEETVTAEETAEAAEDTEETEEAAQSAPAQAEEPKGPGVTEDIPIEGAEVSEETAEEQLRECRRLRTVLCRRTLCLGRHRSPYRR